MIWGWVAIVAILAWAAVAALRQDHRYQLMRLAVEKGVPFVPGGLPGWAVGRRKAVGMLAFGIGLLVAGSFLRITSRGVAFPKEAASENAWRMMVRQAQRGRRHAPAGTLTGRGVGGGPDRPPTGPSMRRLPPPPPDAHMIQWQRAQNQHVAGEAVFAAGLVLAIVGFMQLLLVRSERRNSVPVGAGPAVVDIPGPR